jgi:pimeloyl-ACP methyl ester carboxylesterase
VTVAVGDIRMHYVEAGAGEPLVLIMGLGGDHTAWALQVPAFAQQYRVVSFDNRGAGRTDQPDVPYSIRGMAQDTIGLMDALGIDRAHIAGASLGGMIAQELALSFPDRVRTLQLHCTLGRADAYVRWLGTCWRTMRATLSREDFTRTLMLWLFAPVTFEQRPELVEMVVQTALANPYPASLVGFTRQSEAVGGHDTLARLGELRCPVLITVGAEDNLVPPRFSRQLHERIPGAELLVIPAAGHAYFMEAPQPFNEACLTFLAKHRAR